METTRHNPGPLMTPPEDSGYVALPEHSRTSDGRCFYCDDDPPEWATYEAYRAWWYENEYEGYGTGEFDSGQRHHVRENWEYLAKSCLG